MSTYKKAPPMSDKPVEFTNDEYGIVSTVIPTARGFVVELQDVDSGEWLPSMRIYKPADKDAAIAYAKRIACVNDDD